METRDRDKVGGWKLDGTTCPTLQMEEGQRQIAFCGYSHVQPDYMQSRWAPSKVLFRGGPITVDRLWDCLDYI